LTLVGFSHYTPEFFAKSRKVVASHCTAQPVFYTVFPTRGQGCLSQTVPIMGWTPPYFVTVQHVPDMFVTVQHVPDEQNAPHLGESDTAVLLPVPLVNLLRDGFPGRLQPLAPGTPGRIEVDHHCTPTLIVIGVDKKYQTQTLLQH
jgi:hypothetical protein